MRGVHLSHWGRTSPAQVPPEGASQSLLAAVLGLILETDGYTPGAPEQVIRKPRGSAAVLPLPEGRAGGCSGVGPGRLVPAAQWQHGQPQRLPAVRCAVGVCPWTNKKLLFFTPRTAQKSL